MNYLNHIEAMRRCLKGFFIFTILMVSATAFANVPTHHLLQIQQPLGDLARSKKSKKETRYLLGGVSVYSGEKVEKAHGTRQTEIEMMAQSQKDWGLSYDAGFIYTNEAESFPYPNVPNLYYKTKVNRYTHWVFGRKLFDWSNFDRVWQLGLWQPTVANNLIRPYEQGLTGAFLHYNKKPFKFTGFLTALYVPNMGPQFKVKDGEILSSNRWHQTPIRSVEIKEVDVKVAYDLKIPSVIDIVNQLGVGFNSYWGQEIGPWAQMSMAYKPMNSLHVQFESPRIVLDSDDNLKTPLVVYPKVVMHSLVAIELGWRSSRFNSFVSFTDERPTPPDLEPGMNQPEIPKNQFVAMQLEHDLKIINQPLWYMQWGAFKRVEEEAVLERIDEDLAVDFADTRYPYSDAVMVGARMDFNLRMPVQLTTKLIYSPSQDGTALMTDVQMFTDSGIGILLSFDVIGSGQPKSGEFFNRYRNNDRFFGGISYVF